MLVGAVGAGKSSVGNALCSDGSEPSGPPFLSRRSASGVTTACACAPCLPPGLGGAVVSSASERWWVVDTPGLCDRDDARAPEHLLRSIEACAAPRGAAGSVNPTGGVDVFLLVFNATGRVSSGDLEAIETLKQRFGAARFLERVIVVFTHADVLEAEIGAEDLSSSYLRDAPPALASLLRAAGGGEPVFADVRGIRSEIRKNEVRSLKEDSKEEASKHVKVKARVRFLQALARAVRRVDETTALSSLRSASGDPNETRVVAADVFAAAADRLPKIGMKTARRLRQEEKRKNRKNGFSSREKRETCETCETSSSADWLGDAWAWISNVVAPPPTAATRERETDERSPS